MFYQFSIIDDQFSLSFTNHHKRFDFENTSLQSLMDWFTICDTWCYFFDTPNFSFCNRWTTIERLSFCVELSFKEVISNSNRNDISSASDNVFHIDWGVNIFETDNTGIVCFKSKYKFSESWIELNNYLFLQRSKSIDTGDSISTWNDCSVLSQVILIKFINFHCLPRRWCLCIFLVKSQLLRQLTSWFRSFWLARRPFAQPWKCLFCSFLGYGYIQWSTHNLGLRQK